MIVEIFDVEMGQCAIVQGRNGNIAMIDCGHNTSSNWTPTRYISNTLRRARVDYLVLTNADEDHFSDLAPLLATIPVATVFCNRGFSPDQVRQVKLEQSGEVSTDAEAYINVARTYVHPVAVPFDNGMGGATIETYWNSYPRFTDTNNLSLVAFLKYGNFQIMFPGDLERDGWLALLERAEFRTALSRTWVMVASHHGRRSGYCAEIFDYFTPHCVVISDKSHMHDTQETTALYNNRVREGGVVLTNNTRRNVLTTRNDGDIRFDVLPDSRYTITIGQFGEE